MLYEKGYQKRFNRYGELLAHFTAILVNTQTKKRYKGEDFYNPNQGIKKRINKEKMQKEFEDIVGPMEGGDYHP